MARIHILPEILQNQIAAGEVVERPSSIVKEVLENSIDAGATQLRISIIDGGHGKIRIQDNGSGIHPEDMPLVCVRYATSKLRSAEELALIAQYGFRGEALASIASVARVTIKSKQADGVGKELQIEGGVIGPMTDSAVPDGTIISVEDIFYNTPARKKYLKSAATEFGHISSLIQSYALLHWDKEFLLVHNGKTVLHVQPGTAWEDRIEHVLSPLHSQLLPLQRQAGDLHLMGFFMKPEAVHSKKAQYFYVNGRPIKSPLLSKAVKEAYYRVIPAETSPLVLLSLDLDPNLVDVNVHPRKTEVRFRDEGAVFRAVQEAVQQLLHRPVESPSVELPAYNSQRYAEQRLGTSPTPTYGSRASSPYTIARAERYQQHTPQIKMSLEEALTDTPSAASYTILGQLHRSYIVLQLADGLAVIDQHAAHERVLFERHRTQAVHSQQSSQQLLTPEVVSLTLSEQALVTELMPALEAIGFGLQDLGGGSLGLTRVPSMLEGHSLAGCFQNILQDMSAHVPLEASLIKTQDKLLAYSACKGATKFGDTLTISEMDQLLQDYFSTPLRGTCPHGRPTIREFDLKELAGFFRRPF